MNLRDRLTQAAKNSLSEGLESSKDIIGDNIVPSFEEMGMASVEPGEFAQGEITDQENLVNKGNMSNDNTFNGEKNDAGSEVANAIDDMVDDIVDISDKDEDSEVASIEITQTTEDDAEKCEEKKCNPFGESTFAKLVENALGGKTCEQYLKESGNYAGPLDFVPDTRINVSDVLNTLKHELGEGSEGIHVDQVYDERRNNAYQVSQFDKEKLPKKIQVENVLLELDGDTYKVNKVSDSFPLAR